MKRHAKILILSMVFTAIATLLHVAKPHAEETAAINAANQWLALVDAGHYDKSWEATAKYFRKAVAKDQWRQSLSAFRYPLGNVIARRIRMAKPANSLPGAPDGNYVTITYTTVFTNKKSATETVTPMLDADGIWRVAGYYIK